VQVSLAWSSINIQLKCDIMKSIHWCNLALSDSLLSFFIKVRLCLILFWSLLLHHKHFKHFSSYHFIILIMSSRKSKSNRRWSMYLTLHDDVSRLLEENDLHFNFQENNDIESCTKEYDINIISQFRCHNCACDSNEWSSKRITIIIWMYSEAQYNAKVYHQRCLRCNNFSKSHLDDSYAEKVTYHLKKWCKMKMNRFFYSDQSEDSYLSNLCEKCKNDHCSELWSRWLD